MSRPEQRHSPLPGGNVFETDSAFNSVDNDKMSLIFSNKVFLLVGVTNKQRQIVRDKIEGNGGKVLDPRPPALFGPISLPSDLTHIVVETKNQTYDRSTLLRTMNASDMSDDIVVVSVLWIGESVRLGFQDTEKFVLTAGTKLAPVHTSVHTEIDIEPFPKKVKAAATSPVSLAPVGEGSDLNSKNFLQFKNLDWEMLSFDSWHENPSFMFKFNAKSQRDVQYIALDMDGTVIATKSGKVFAEDQHDWKLWDTNVSKTFRQLHSQGKSFLIVSNQNGVSKGKMTKQALRSKVETIITAIGVPVDFICSFEDDLNRKPRRGPSFVDTHEVLKLSITDCVFVCICALWAVVRNVVIRPSLPRALGRREGHHGDLCGRCRRPIGGLTFKERLF